MKQKQKIKSKYSESKKTVFLEIRKQRLILALIVGIFGFLLYSNTLTHDYVLDDFSVIKENNIVRQGIKAIPEIFRTSYRQGYLSLNDGTYRPLSLAMFAVEWNFFPNTPAVSHFVNVLLYGITGFLLFIILCKLFASSLRLSHSPLSTSPPASLQNEMGDGSEVLAFIASLLFIAHPLHVEVVANIKSRDEILCFLFVLCSFLSVFHFLETGK
jgi:hypothetical protein